MIRMFQCLDLFVLSCVFLSVESQTGQISPPQNVSLLWVKDFYPQLSWVPPQHSEKECKYLVKSKDEDYTKKEPSWSNLTVMEGGFLKLSVETVCDNQHSEPVVINITNPELVRDLQCYIRSSKQSYCTWLPAINAPELSFFYWLVSENFMRYDNDSSPSSHLQECSSYRKTGNVRTGCALQANISHKIYMLFNGTLNNTLVRNTFTKEFKDNVRPPPLNWTVTKTENEYIIKWVPPDIKTPFPWQFTINYTACGKSESKAIEGENSFRLASDCLYSMTIRAHTSGGETPWSEKYFDTGPNAAVYATFIIPLMFAGLAALTFVCCRKNKEKIFPKVPEPRDLLSDISDNNNKSTVHNLYVPAEEDDCKITLVLDPQISQLYS